nr:MAG TPA: hypothetical protein [Caudoviricetes sp.]
MIFSAIFIGFSPHLYYTTIDSTFQQKNLLFLHFVLDILLWWSYTRHSKGGEQPCNSL